MKLGLAAPGVVVSNRPVHYVYLAIAIVAEVFATSTLKATQAFTKLGPSLVVVVGYAVAFYCLTLSLQRISLGVAYAVWAGAGTALVTLVGVFLYKESLDAPAILGLVLIVTGVLVLNLFSKTVVH